MLTEKEIPNRLIHEKSPYLLQHAYNPVEWYPWGEAAFTAARERDCPIFLSIGYSTCHWCHVMERESFENEEVAAALNKDFVCIKVDREERPDIDTIYMDICQALTGHGGWPLTIVMTPDKKPFYAATYLPKSSRGGISGMLQILPRIGELWRNDRESVLRSSESIAGVLQQVELEAGTEELSRDLFSKAFQYYTRVFDSLYGGFNPAPKFPSPHNLTFLLRYYEWAGDKKALEMVDKTLESMYRGGMYDHIGFGFARYSTDRQWLVPHFEKMLYDNALLAIAYLQAYQASGRELFARVAREIFTYVLRDMTSPEGGFYSAEDADSEGEEGKFYVWTPEEVKSVLGDEKGQYFCGLYDIQEKGNFEGHSIPNLIHKLINEEERNNAEMMRSALFAYRDQRNHPYKDDKILTAWNGMMIAALALGARILKEDHYLQAAERATVFILDKLRQGDGRLLARYRDGEAQFPAYALDYAALIWACIEIYQANFNSYYLQKALELNQDVIKYFWDEERGGVYFYGKDGEQLISRPKESYDGAIPSGNSLTAWNLVRLARLSGDESLEAKAEQSMRVFAASINEHPAAYSFFLIAALDHLHPGQEIVLVGSKKAAESQQMVDQVNSRFLPRSLLMFKESDGNGIIYAIPYVREMEMVDGRTTAYLCDKNSCQPPVNTIRDFSRLLSQVQAH